MTVFWRYWLLQVPGWVLLGAALAAARYYFGLSTLWAVAVFVLWLLKDAALYPWLGRHYEIRSDDAAARLLGRPAIAQEALAPVGYVKIGGELWRAEVNGDATPISPGEVVLVESIEGLTLRVRRSESLSASLPPPPAR